MFLRINPITITDLKLVSFHGFITKLIALIKKIGADNLKISTPFNNLLLPAFKKFDEAYKKGKKSSFTEKIKLLDKSRDEIISAIFGVISISLKDIAPDVREAGREIDVFMGDFKGISKLPLKDQTTDTTKMIEGLEGKHAENAQKIGLTKWIPELKRLNTEIDSYIDERIEEKTDRNKKDTVAAKKEVNSAYRNICKLVEVYVSTEGAANYEDFIRNLNTIIGEYGESGKTQTDNDDDDAGDITPTEPDVSTPPNDQETHEEKMAKARPFSEINTGEWKVGDYCWHLVNGTKTYFKLLDVDKKDAKPYIGGNEAVWEKMS